MTEHSEPPGPRPRLSRARAIVTVVLGLVVTGVLVGALWAWIAPPVHAVVAIARSGERVHDYLGRESENFFVAPLLLLGLMTVVAALAVVLVWQWREHRGPSMLLGLSIGLMAGTATAAMVGALLVLARYGALDFDSAPLSGGDHRLTYVTQAPPVFFARRSLQVAASLLTPAGIAALVYALLAAGCTRDDLGGYPPEDWRPDDWPQTVPTTTPEAASHSRLTTDGDQPSVRRSS